MSRLSGPWTKPELAWIFMTYGLGAQALRDLGISQKKFWALTKKGKSQ